MRIALNIVGGLALIVGGMWTLQGANVIGGSVMSGQSQWLYIGVVVVIAGGIALWWANRRRS